MSDTDLVLQVVGGSGDHALPKSGMLVLGASSDAGVTVEGQGVDDTHCAIGPVKGGGWAIKDLGSKYGTILNGKKVQTARLAAGDTLLLGSRRVRIVDPSAPPPPAEATPAPAASSAPIEASKPAAEAPKPAAAPARKPAPTPKANGGGKAIPKVIGGYKVDRLLGRGGMGTVLLAEQESLHRPVALKLLPPRLASDASFVQRFQKEARAAAALNHPNVVVVHDVGEADGYHFLSMEYMERGSLEDRLKTDGRIGWREVLDILHDAARGLMFAEEKRIIHRDIKPANLMQNAAGTIKIADLGLATNLEADAEESEGRKILGTPHFIAPEQARGGAIDHRADLYSLGATAYHLLAGRTPFVGETTRDILRGHLTVEPESLLTHVPAIPEGLDRLVLRLLAKEPDDRPQAAEELLAEVDRLRLEADHGVAVATGSKAGSKMPLIAGGAALVLAIAGFAMFGGGESGANEIDDPTDAVAGGGGSQETGLDPDDLDGGTTEIDDGILGGPADAGDGGAGAAEDLEATLRERNLLAENAYLRIDPNLSPADRVAELESLVADYAGTDTAARADEEIGTLRAEIAAAEAEAARIAAAIGDTESKLRAACGLPTPEGELPRPNEQLRQAASFDIPATIAADLASDLVARIEDEIVAAATASFAGALGEIDALAAEGRFTEVESRLRDLLPRFDLPTYEPGAAPAGIDALILQGDTVRGRLNRLPSEAQLWADHRSAADRELIAESLRGDGALKQALASLDLDAAIQAANGLSARLGTDERRAFADALAADLGAAHATVESLSAAFAAGEWRRKSVLDPRGTRATARDAVGLDQDGVHVDVKGSAELVPWSAYAASSEAVIQLFKERLERDYTAAEEQGAAAILRITCALEASELASQMLDLTSGSHFSDAEHDSLLALYAAPEEFVQANERFAREREAAGILAGALSDLEASIWSSAESGLALLLDGYADTLLVAFLSDGVAWRDAETGAEDQ